MHPAWYIDDIKYLIFEHLEPQDLARLARSSRALFQTATDKLWGTLSSFEGLVCCLPLDFDKRPLGREDLVRLDFYTFKVRYIRLGSGQANVTMPLPRGFSRSRKKKDIEKTYKKSWEELWEEIAEVRPPSELFCNLRRLRINKVFERLLIPLIGISGLHLTKIYIKYFEDRQWDSVVRRVLSGFQDTPNLEYIFVRDGEVGYLPRKLIQQSPLKHVRLDPKAYPGGDLPARLEDVPVRFDVLQKSTLEHLTIGLKSDWCTPEIEALEGKYLPALKTLWLNILHYSTDIWHCDICNDKVNRTWVCENREVSDNLSRPPRRSPAAFFKRLDNPALSLLNIKFPNSTNGRMLLEVVSAVKRSCRLRKLRELSLVGGQESHYRGNPSPMITPEELRAATKMLLPLPKLKLFCISVAPNFLDVLDLDLYQSIANGLPALETLWLGLSMFVPRSYYAAPGSYESVRLSHLAAFCQMLPRLVEVSVGTAELEEPGEVPHPEFVCSHVKSVRVSHWAQRVDVVPRERMLLSQKMYFPNAKLKE
ncbi:putative F-box domain-containing protein [Seiridium unicorne]|uniref:F-box domain-containing protein n=1 Tax=Seiridium unicorne TaxID=138068 RepID=A0ABR2UQI0_9PEZI